MINCFEARQEFVAFWRRELPSERRIEFTNHLANCTKCDRAFRNFAISAPVLHSASEPPGRQATERPAVREAHARRPSSVARGHYERRRGFAMSAAAMMLVAASLAAYFSVKAPVASLSDELSADPVATQFFGSDLNLSGEDLAG